MTGRSTMVQRHTIVEKVVKIREVIWECALRHYQSVSLHRLFGILHTVLNLYPIWNMARGPSSSFIISRLFQKTKCDRLMIIII